MAEAWGIELAKGIGKLFLNPLLYWTILLVILTGNRRIRKERNNFGTRVLALFSEWKNTWKIAFLSGLFLSLIALGTGMVFSYETIFLLSIVTIILSLSLRFSMLSASYTIGITYLLLLFLPVLLENQTFVGLDADAFSYADFSGLVILLGTFLVLEAVLVKRIKRNELFPELVMGKRGKWVGQHRMKKVSLVPLFVLVPTGMITSFAPYWPFFSIGEDTYSIVLFPFLLGFDHIIKGGRYKENKAYLSKSIGLLSFIIVLLAIASMYYPWASFAAIIIAILGREFINYMFRLHERKANANGNWHDKGLTVLAIMQGSPADRLGILVGETIVKVNGQKIQDVGEFYLALQESGSFFKLELLDDMGEVRFLKSALYQGDHHELGIIFVKDRYRKEK